MKKIVVFINDIDYFFSHKYNYFNYISSKYKIYVLCPNFKKNIYKFNKIIFINLSLSRKMIKYNDLFAIYKFYNIIKKISPNLVHSFTIKPIIISLIISKIYKQPLHIFNFSGFGYYSVSKKIFDKLIWSFVLIIFKIIRSKRVYYLFQNIDQLNFFKSKINISSNQLIIIPSSGVDTLLFNNNKKKFDEKSTKILFCSRLLKTKGIFSLLEAAELLKNENIIFNIIGTFDKNNPNSLTEKDLYKYKKNKKIIFHGFKKDVLKYYKEASVFCYPSFYGEGVPKSLIEALSCSLPILTTKHPGCKETVIENYNGFYIDHKNIKDLKNKILYLAKNKKLLEKFSLNSRKIALENYDLNKINTSTLNCYKSILN